jgi:hypothetical protein
MVAVAAAIRRLYTRSHAAETLHEPAR